MSRLENLVQIGTLEAEPPDVDEIKDLVHSGSARLKDATNPALSLESRFDLAYNAAFALSLAALRSRGYRPKNRYVVFQALEETLQVPPAQWRVLAKAHDHRNRTEYGGRFDVEIAIVDAIIRVATDLEARLRSTKGA